jgi:hypothetical protein
MKQRNGANHFLCPFPSEAGSISIFPASADSEATTSFSHHFSFQLAVPWSLRLSTSLNL